MQGTSYSSAADTKIITLAEATWREFRPYLSRYQWAFDDPRCSPRAAEIVSALRNKGRKGSNTFLREGGWKFILRPLHAWAFGQALERHRRVYYVSYGRQALLYLDIDLHRDWQTPGQGQEARRLIDALLRKVFGQDAAFWSPSSRGLNGYLKVDLQGRRYEAANRVFDRLEQCLQRFLAFYGNLADFEVKGKVGFLRDAEYSWQQYGKLPLHAGWDFDRLEEFRARPTVPLAGLGRLCQAVEARVPPEVLERHEAHKKGLGDRPPFEGGYFLVTPAVEGAIRERHGDVWWPCLFAGSREDREGNVWLAEKYYRPGRAPLTELEWQQEAGATRQAVTVRQPGPQGQDTGKSPQPPVAPSPEQPSKPVQQPVPQGQVTGPGNPGPRPAPPSPEQPSKRRTPPLKVNVKVVDLASEPDSFVRQKEALFRLARHLKRVPSLDEALKYLHDENLFTGPWEEHRARRTARVKSILGFIGRTFDPGRCAQGAVNVGKYDAWAAEKFPDGLTGRTRSRLTEEGDKVDGQEVNVGRGFIAVFLAVCEFALLTDKNRDGSLPHRRAEELWQALFAKGLVAVPFDARKWAVCREGMVRHGLVVITDRDYHTGKAMRWALGPYFPFLGLWRRSKPKSLPGPGSLVKKKRATTRQHNTLLRQQPRKIGLVAHQMPARPPH
jgi:hypothetical protein